MSISKKTLKMVNSNKGTVLTICGMIGVGVTAVASFKAGMKASEMIQNGDIHSGMSTKEKIKVCGKIIAKPLLAEFGTLIFIANAHLFDKKQKNVLMAMVNDYVSGTNQYSSYIKKIAGEDVHKNALRQMVENNPDRVLLYDKKSKKYIETTVEACMIDDDMECYIVDLHDVRDINIDYNEN